MKWRTIEALTALAPLPAGYRYEKLHRAHIAPVIAALGKWRPEISAGASSCYLREEFYRDRVCLEGEADRDIFAVRIMFAGEMAGFWLLEREPEPLAIYGRFLAVAPAHRGAHLFGRAMAGTERIGREMGAAFTYMFATLRHPYAQQALEEAGYRLLGFFPGYDREEIAPGVIKRVYQAAYAKLLVPESEVQWPAPENMTAKARGLFALLFPERPQAAGK
ncbi:MAG TPA: hypothetical protein VKC56_09970 [Gallionellaceae bacterium]|nr:hypothetical protein [Gallionellaceae bacterium]